MPRKKPEQDFETSLNALEQLVESMEKGEMSLEESLNAFERGVELTRYCRDTLKQAEQRVAILSKESSELEPFDSDA